MREIADKVGALLMADMAHIAGLICAGNAPNPFDYCHLVTTTTHKTLRGPRGALVFALKKHQDKSLIDMVNESTFPGFQGGPHNHTIGAIAVALKEANTPQFKAYSDQIVKNAKVFAEGLMKRGYKLFTDGTDNHIIMVNLRDKNVDGGKVEFLFNFLGISINKNTLKGDTNAKRPSGIRLGTPAMTTREAKESDFEQIAEFIHRGISYVVKANTFKKMSEYQAHIVKMVQEDKELLNLKAEITAFAEKFPFNNLAIE